MTKPKMPDPVAIYKPEYGICWTSSGMAVEAVDGIQFITTTQAEAYADARVREVLEAAIAICDAAYEQGKSEYRTSCNPYFEGGCDAAESIESKIRALIPPLPGPATEPKDKS